MEFGNQLVTVSKDNWIRQGNYKVEEDNGIPFLHLDIDQFIIKNEFQIPTEKEIQKSLDKEIGTLLD